MFWISKLVKRRKKLWRIGRWFTVSQVAEEIPQIMLTQYQM